MTSVPAAAAVDWSSLKHTRYLWFTKVVADELAKSAVMARFLVTPAGKVNESVKVNGALDEELRA